MNVTERKNDDMKKTLALLLALCMAATSAVALAQAAPETSGYSGTVAYSRTLAVTAPFGGMLEDYDLRVGDAVAAGQPLFTLRTTKVYAPIDGTVRGLLMQAGEEAAAVQARYGALLSLEPTGRYVIYASTNNAYNTSTLNNENRYLTAGETVYLVSSDDDERTGVGVITQVNGRDFTIEVRQSNLNVEEKVTVYRDAEHSTRQRLATYARVEQAAATQITAEGSVLRIAVTEGQAVKRGDLLLETVTGTLAGLTPAEPTVTAPVDGVLVTLPRAAGDEVQQDGVLATLYANSDMCVTFDVDEGDLGTIAEGIRVRVTADAQPDWPAAEGTVTAISQMNTQGEGDATYTATVKLDDIGALRVGMNVSVYLP